MKKPTKSKTKTVKEKPKTEPGDDKISLKDKPHEEADALIKEIEQTIFTIKFYPVAVTEDKKNESVKKIKEMFKNGDVSTRQLILYIFHETLSQSADIKTMHIFEYYKQRAPNADPAKHRMSVYRAMFNYNFSLEGLIEIIRIISELDGDEPAKVLTYHFSFLSAIESEGNHMLRNAIIDGLGNSNSKYALKALLEYAKYSDSERTLQRVISSLARWDKKIVGLNVSEEEKEKLRDMLDEMISIEFWDSHYG